MSELSAMQKFEKWYAYCVARWTFVPEITPQDLAKNAYMEGFRQGSAPQWQPIETAPTNSIDVLLCLNNGNGITTVGRKYPLGWVDQNLRSINPTHWMPLPSAPKEK